MKFISKEHYEFFKKYGVQYMKTDEYRAAFFYVTGICEGTRENIQSLYDFKTGLIKPEGLCEGWQTGSSTALTRLAFDLFHADPVFPENDPDPVETARLYSVSNIMCKMNEWLPYAIEAINFLYDKS